MKGKSVIIMLFVAAAAAILFTSLRRGGTPSRPASAPVVPPAASVTTISMLYGTEKQAFIEEMAAAFQKDNPHYKLALILAGSLEAADRILDRREAPAVFSPGDSLVLKMLASDYEAKHGEALLETDGPGAPQPLVISPLVFVAWEGRGRALEKAAGGHVTWKVLRKALTAPKGWAALGGDPEWGFVKLGHTNPTRSNSGLQALVSMATEVHGPRPLTVSDLLAPELQSFIKDIEMGVAKLESSTGTFMTDMVRFGPSKYDIAVVYESLAIAQIANAQGRWGNLRVYYPSPTVWSDHPIALLKSARMTEPERAGALAWIAFLRGPAAQGRALTHGFRPADPSVPLQPARGSADDKNPFSRLAAFGLKIDIPPAAPMPDGPVVRNLLTFWTRLGLR